MALHGLLVGLDGSHMVFVQCCSLLYSLCIYQGRTVALRKDCMGAVRNCPVA